MGDPVNGFEMLEMLREKNGKQTQNFKNFSRYLDFKAREKGVPLHGQFELTPLCNFSCRMCYVHLNADQLKGRAVLSTDTWKDLMRQAWEAGMIGTTLTGGECLTYPGFDELYLYLQSLGCEVTVLTNGYLLDDRRIQFFKKHPPATIQITLYGCNDDVYERVTGQRAFGVVIENVRKAVAAELPVRLNVTPSRFLGEDTLETVRIGKGITKAFIVNSAIFPPREETGRAAQRDDPDMALYLRVYRLLDELDGWEAKEVAEEKMPPVGGPSHECAECGLPCGGGRSSFVINWEGVMMPCNRMSMISANVPEEGFSAAWARVNQGASAWPRVPECEGCVYRSACLNCTANMLRFAEPGKQPLGLCEQTKYFVRHGVRHIPECE